MTRTRHVAFDIGKEMPPRIAQGAVYRYKLNRSECVPVRVRVNISSP